MFVPRLMDATNRNPQNNNARMLLQRWPAGWGTVRTVAYEVPDPLVTARDGVEVVRLWRRHAWQPHLAIQYLRRSRGIFYPGVSTADVWGIRIRRAFGMHGRIVATLEGLLGDAERAVFYSSVAGHSVHCQPVTATEIARADSILESADHVIAISPFLARMGRARYGDKFSVLPLGIDTETFRPFGRCDAGPASLRVIGAGRVAPHKRPELFLRLAAAYPRAQFCWYGEGESRLGLVATAQSMGLRNAEFPGALAPSDLANEFRRAAIFVLPSLSEGVPKVTQEAAACGLPVVVFGHYETPSVVHEVTGIVVWSDDELVGRLGGLLADASRRESMGREGASAVAQLGWDAVAPLWLNLLDDLLFAKQRICS